MPNERIRLRGGQSMTKWCAIYRGQHLAEISATTKEAALEKLKKEFTEPQLGWDSVQIIPSGSAS